MPRYSNLQDRIWANVQPIPFSGCWIWMSGIAGSGYGELVIDHRHRQAHRVSYEAFKGPIPSGLLVCHSCDIPLCVNPDHLWLGTRSQNMRDSIAKGRQREIVGATYIARKDRWQAQIGFDGRSHYLGLFKTKDAAIAAYRAALNRIQTERQAS